jgi:hypothetical protein
MAPLVLLAFCLPLHAARIPVAGRVVDSGGKGVAGIKVLLVPLASVVEDAKLELAGKDDPEPAASASTDAGGAFRIEAPDAGMWKVRLEAKGFVPLEIALFPLTEETELPDARLLPDAGLKVTVTDPAGKPAAGARVRIANGQRSFSLGASWSVPGRLAVTSADGTAVLPRAAEEGLTIKAAAAGFPPVERKAVRTATASLRLAAGKIRALQVRDAKGQGVAGVVVLIADWPAGRTAESGTIDLSLPDAGGADLKLAAEDGRRLELRLKAAKPDDKGPAVARLPALEPLAGKVLSRDGRPLAGAEAWLFDDPGAAVRTGSDGTFRLPATAGSRAFVGGAAAGFFPGELDAGSQRTVNVSLPPKLAATGIVVDESGRGLPGAGINAVLAPGMLRRDFSLYRSGGFTRSGTGGRFRLANLGTGMPYSLRVNLPGFAPATAELPAREAGTPAQPELRIVMRVGRQATGTVVDGSRAGVAGARVTLRPSASGDLIRRLMDTNDKDAPATTDARGRFAVGHLPAGTYDLLIGARGFAPLTVPGLVLPEGQGTTDLGTVMLGAGAAVEGRVVDPQGRPIDGAEVRIAKGGRGMMIPFSRGDSSPPDAFTAADGSFRLADRSPGESLDLTVSHPSYGPGSAPGVAVPTQEPVRIVLQPNSRVSGRALGADGKGIGGARLILSEMTPRSFGSLTRLSSGSFKEAVADEDGAFSYPEVAPGPIEITASAPRHQSAELKGLEVKAGQELTGISLVLPPAAVVEGRVLGPDGRPVPGAEVGVLEAGTSPFGGSLGSFEVARTDGDGRYALDGVALGPRTLKAEADGYGRAVRDLEVKEGANAADFTLDKGFEVSGRVVDEAGAGVATSQLLLVAGMGSGMLTATSGTDGSFRFAGVQEGTFRLSARKTGYAMAQVTTVTVSGASVGGLEMKLTAGGAITGRLSGLELSQLSRVRVQLSRMYREGQVDAEGNYRIDNVQPGEWQVSATVPDTPLHAEGEVTLEPGMAEAKLDLQFGKGFTLTGVLLKNGSPFPGASLELTRTGTIDQRQASSDHQGVFRFGGLESGGYELEVGTAGGGRHKEAVEISGDREVRIDLKVASLAGRVIDGADSSPVAGAEVTLEPADDRRALPTDVTTDSRGAFRLAEVTDGAWKLRASHDGYAPAEKEVRVEGGDAGEVELSLSSTEGLTLEVALPSGQAPERIHAGVLDIAGNLVASGYYPVGENGRARLKNVPPGSWQLLVDSDSWAPVTLAASVPGPVLRVALPPAGRVRVKVPALARDGVIARVSLTGPGGAAYRTFDFSGRVTTEWNLNSGYAIFGRVPPGAWRVTARAVDGRTWTGTAAVVAGSEVEVTLN